MGRHIGALLSGTQECFYFLTFILTLQQLLPNSGSKPHPQVRKSRAILSPLCWWALWDRSIICNFKVCFLFDQQFLLGTEIWNVFSLPSKSQEGLERGLSWLWWKPKLWGDWNLLRRRGEMWVYRRALWIVKRTVFSYRLEDWRLTHFVNLSELVPTKGDTQVASLRRNVRLIHSGSAGSYVLSPMKGAKVSQLA